MLVNDYMLYMRRCFVNCDILYKIEIFRKIDFLIINKMKIMF